MKILSDQYDVIVKLIPTNECHLCEAKWRVVAEFALRVYTRHVMFVVLFSNINAKVATILNARLPVKHPWCTKQGGDSDVHDGFAV